MSYRSKELSYVEWFNRETERKKELRRSIYKRPTADLQALVYCRDYQEEMELDDEDLAEIREELAKRGWPVKRGL